VNIDNRHYYYWIIPTIIGAILVAMHFYGAPWMQTFVSPRFHRELGAPENIQNLIIFATFILGFIGAKRKGWKIEKIAFYLVSAGSLFLLMEEMDYGRHLYKFFIEPSYKNKIWNVHFMQQGLLNKILLVVVYTMLPLFFCFLPFYAKKSTNPWVKYLSPAPHSLGTVLGMILVSQVSQYLNNLPSFYEFSQQSTMIMSEFGEGYIHLLFFLYFYEIVFNRKTPDYSAFEKKFPRLA
jgi:hypothetical protein